MLDELGNETNAARDALIANLRESYEQTRNLADIDDSVSALLSECARIIAIEEELRRIISLRYRLKLKFVKTPFVQNTDILLLYENSAVSQAEMVNILRQNAGLDKIDEAEVERIEQEKLELQSNETKVMTMAASVTSDTPPDKPA